MAEIDQALVERMVALVRRMASRETDVYQWDRFGASSKDYDTACAIDAELPKPVDPDLVEAISVIVEHYGPTLYPDGRFMPGYGPARIDDIKNRNGDAYWETGVALAAIKRGRELQKEGR